MSEFFYVIVSLAAIAGGGLLFMAFIQTGAPQQAAITAIAIGVAVVPYVFARAVDRIAAIDRERQMLAALNAMHENTRLTLLSVRNESASGAR